MQHFKSGSTELTMSGQSPLTWIDPETGLEWQNESPGRMPWAEAMTYADSLSLNGKADWRLPTCKELETLLDRSKYRPVMRTEVPFRDTLSYWSSTILAGIKTVRG